MQEAFASAGRVKRRTRRGLRIYRPLIEARNIRLYN